MSEYGSKNAEDVEVGDTIAEPSTSTELFHDHNKGKVVFVAHEGGVVRIIARMHRSGWSHVTDLKQYILEPDDRIDLREADW
jgi:hypothetical protein